MTATAAGVEDRCVACGGGSVAPWRRVASFDHRSAHASYELRRCAECGTAVTSGRTAEDAASLYVGGAYAVPPRIVDRLLEPLRHLGDRATLAALGDVGAGARVLDLGAGDGRLVRLLRRRGCDVLGIEPFAATDPDAPVVRARIEDARVEPGSADVVVLWHVLEHLEDPSRAIGLAASALRPGGRVVVSVPSLDSLQARVGGDRWFHLDVPRHAVHFTRSGLLRLLERQGLRPVRTRDVVLDQNLLGMTVTLLNRLTGERNVAFRLLKGEASTLSRRDLAVTVVSVAPVALGGSLVEGAAMAAGRGGAIVVDAVRSDA